VPRRVGVGDRRHLRGSRPRPRADHLCREPVYVGAELVVQLTEGRVIARNEPRAHVPFPSCSFEQSHSPSPAIAASSLPRPGWITRNSPDLVSRPCGRSGAMDGATREPCDRADAVEPWTAQRGSHVTVRTQWSHGRRNEGAVLP
jgi:hypothetical protein